MTHLQGTLLALAAAAGSWILATRAARSRRLCLGAAPAGALPVIAALAALPPPVDAERFIVLGGVTVAAITNLRTGRIFTAAARALAGAALAAALCEGHIAPALAGCVALGAALWCLQAVTRGRGLGQGDVRLACAVGAGLGVAGGFVAFAWAFVLGALYGSTLLLLGRAHRRSEIRFAPFIAAGTFVALLPGTSP